MDSLAWAPTSSPFKRKRRKELDEKDFWLQFLAVDDVAWWKEKSTERNTDRQTQKDLTNEDVWYPEIIHDSDCRRRKEQ